MSLLHASVLRASIRTLGGNKSGEIDYKVLETGENNRKQGRRCFLQVLSAIIGSISIGSYCSQHILYSS